MADLRLVCDGLRFPEGPIAMDDGTVVVVEIQSAPVRLTGSLSLGPDGAGTAEQVDGDQKASLPLVGGKIEKAAEPAIRAAIGKEQEIGRGWLA